MALPTPFISVEDMLPPQNKPVLAIRRSGYVTTEYEVITAKHMPEYRPLNPWQTIGNDSVTDSGEEVLGWAEMDAWLLPCKV
jgi:hypothetical protein